MIKIANLNKAFGNKTVLNNIDLELTKGKVCGIVGENGAGKTTLFRCIAGLEKYEGNIESEYDHLKNYLGFVQTEPYFFSKITGKEYLRLLCSARKVEEVDFDQKNIFDLPLDQFAQTYSTGMKKKLAILGVLLQNNEAFILDEPFNGVDIQSNLIITEIIHKLKYLNKTIVISSHIFSTLSAICDEIYLLKEGQFVKKVDKDAFHLLEQEMKEVSVGNRVDELGLE